MNYPEPTGIRPITGKRYTATVNLETMELVIDRDDEHGNLTKEDLMRMDYIRTDEKR